MLPLVYSQFFITTTAILIAVPTTKIQHLSSGLGLVDNDLSVSSQDFSSKDFSTIDSTQPENLVYSPQLIYSLASTQKAPVEDPKPQPPANPKPAQAIAYQAPVEFEHYFYEFGEAFGVNPQALMHIAKCESHMNPASQSKNGLYGGMYQYMSSTWESTRNSMGADPNPDLRFDAKEAIYTTAFKIAVGGIGAWPHCSKSAPQPILISQQ